VVETTDLKDSVHTENRMFVCWFVY